MLAGTAVVSVVAPRIFLLPVPKLVQLMPFGSYSILPELYTAFVDPKIIEILVRPIKAAQIYEGMLISGKGIPNGTKIIARI